MEQKYGTQSREELRGYFEQINESGTRQVNLVDDLLDLSKMEAARMKYQKAHFALREPFDKTKETFRLELQEKNLSVEIMDSEDTMLLFDLIRMRQVADNLISNAVKFANVDSTIFVYFKRISHEVTITVQNEGIPIPKKETGLVFDAFEQSSATRPEVGGTGLGLAISKRIIEDHRGTMWCEYNPNGATFKIRLPIEIQ